MRILVVGWTKVPHSYAIVNSFQLVHLKKNFPNVTFYKQEYKYFNPEWKEKDIYPKEYTEILNSIPVYNNEPIDLVYSITYPYDLSEPIKDVPKVVFYTAEFSTLTTDYFTGSENVPKRIHDPSLYFHSPSKWSHRGLENTKNYMITHGVDTRLFYKDKTYTSEIRKLYGVKETDILLGNMGAMTRNKGIVLLLQTLKVLVVDLKLKNYKLLLKGTGDLYKTKDFLKIYIDELQLPEEVLEHIIFTQDTLSFYAMNHMYNAIDLYVSPYFAEGFNLQPLECLSTGTTVILPETGSTVDYTSKVMKVSPDSVIQLPSKVVFIDNKYQNELNLDDLLNCIINYAKPTEKYHELRKLIEKELSWDYVSKKLHDLFKEIV